MKSLILHSLNPNPYLGCSRCSDRSGHRRDDGGNGRDG